MSQQYNNEYERLLAVNSELLEALKLSRSTCQAVQDELGGQETVLATIDAAIAKAGAA